MKLYLDLDEIDNIPEAYQKSATDIMRITGLNTGNFAFRHALRHLVSDLDSYKLVNWGNARKLIEQKVKAEKLLISCANWLGFSEADERSNLVRAKVIEDFGAPVVAFGLGAQASSVSQDLELGPNTARLARAISNHSEQVSVRDHFTLTLLQKAGIQNAIVTGCPSNLINQSDDFIKNLSTQAKKSREKSLNFQKFVLGEFSGGNEHSGAVLRKTLGFMNVTNSNYLIQSPVLYPFFLRESDEIPAPYRANKPDGISHERLAGLLKQQVLGFSSIDSWLDFSRTCDLSFGMRIHGNMIPLQAGVPSVLIAHDSRTLGLSDSMAFPRIPLSIFLKTDLLDLPELMYTEFLEQLPLYEDKRQHLKRVFRDYLEANNI
ncbi:polysaccharide pyruvyl transferase family protein [Gilvimarinus sp. DA14]|uniref:polysaccharide pyruvyl transferase family protein n=1 Tax=Gilvimarinus sp. DA14 TaxID=2956798 RepID=UPI0020B689EC|nr:polysaccharide pyruvyl transferase family protein [Gilvimarinus sp. DA14]UTF59558.1 polysaccharide pyruvyl transferase family protein [Gilvimarinus sp. DA14]